MATTRENMLRGKEALTIESVPTPEWGGETYVRMLSGDEVEDAMAIVNATGSNGKLSERDAMAGMCALCVCDKDGSRLLTADDVPMLLAGPLAPIWKCAQVALRINGLSDDAVTELAGNSSDGPPEDSPSV